MPLTLAQADRIASRTLAEGKRLEMKPMAVVVVDTGGHTLVLKRHEEAGFFYNDLATAKAWSAVGVRRGTKATGARAMKNGLMGALTAVGRGRFMALPGAVLIRDKKGRIVGAVGVAGVSGGDKDEACAVAALTALGFLPETEPG